MARAIVLDELHLTLTAARDLPEPTYRAIYRTLRGRSFRAALHRAIRKVFGSYPTLRPVRAKLSH